MVHIFAQDCLDPAKQIQDKSVHLGIFDPPFGIGEADFDHHYKRANDKVLKGYKEAPDNYAEWTLDWMTEAKRVLRDDGSMYVIMGHSQLRHILNAAAELGLHEINHLIWKFKFGVYTSKKFVTSHYHILYYSKTKERRFNVNCRFGSQEKDAMGKSLLFKDLEDVFDINKQYAPGEIKNQNKLPDDLIQKLILYSSNAGDTVCDFFMGNFTTAYVARELGRHVCGYEINREAYDYHIAKVKATELGCGLIKLKQVENIVPENQGKKLDEATITAICQEFLELEGRLKRSTITQQLQTTYGRGRFAIKNILDEHLDRIKNIKNRDLGDQQQSKIQEWLDWDKATLSTSYD